MKCWPFEFTSAFLALASASTLAFSGTATAQCLDFATNFGIPGSGLQGSTNALAVFDDGSGPRLYAGGYFTNYSNARVVRWDGASWTIAAAGDGYGEVFEMCVWNDGSGDKLYATGNFLTIDGVSANQIASFDGVTWSEVGGGISSNGRAMVVHDDGSGPKLFVGGSFTLAGSTPCTRVARWDGASWTAVGSTLPSTVQCLASYDSGSGPQLYAGGSFVGKVQRWDGTSWSVLAAANPYGNSAYALTVFDEGQGPRLFVGGDLSYGGNYGGVMRWDGTSWSQLPDVSNHHQVYALGSFDLGSGPRLYAAGRFNYAGVDPPSGLVDMWNGASWTHLSIGIGAAVGVWDLAQHDDGSGPKLFLGGEFGTAGGNPSKNIARWGDPCQAPVVTVQPQSQLAVFDGQLTPILFTTAAVGLMPITYQWRFNGVALQDVAQRITGSTTPQLRVYRWSLDDAGDYDCVITNPLGTVTTQVATLTVPLPMTGQSVAVAPLLVPPVPVGNLPLGAAFSTVSQAAPSSSGETTFFADITGTSGGTKALGRLQNGVANVVVRSLDPAPGCEPGAVHDSYNPFLRWQSVSNGRFAFYGMIQGGTVPQGNYGIWYHDGTTTQLVAREGLAAIGAPAGETWRSFSGPISSDAGRVVFYANRYVGNVAVAAGMWSWDATNGVRAEILGGQPGPGSSANVVGFFDTYANGQDAAGNIVMLGQLDSLTGYSYHSPPYDKDTAIWYGPSGALQLIVKSGDPAPGFSPSDNIEEIVSKVVAPNGDIYISAWVAGPAGFHIPALFRWSQGTLTLLAKRGDPAPGVAAGSTLFSFVPRAANSTGDVAFYSNLSNPCPGPCPSQALYVIGSAGPPALVVANRMDPLLGAAPNFTLSSIDDVAINDSRQVAFNCSFYYGTTTYAVYGWTPSRGLFPIAAPGSQFEVTSGVHRTELLGLISPSVAGASTGSASGLSSSGELTLSLNFTWTHSGVYSAQFLYLLGLQLGFGQVVCAGDGSGAACPCGNTGSSGEGCANSTGEGATLSVSGTNRVSEDDLEFHAAGMPASVPALLFQGLALVGAGPGLPFKDGIKCAGGPTRRFGVVQSDALGAATWGAGLASHGAWAAGETRFFQVWYRDGAGSPCAKFSNLTSTLSVTFAP